MKYLNAVVPEAKFALYEILYKFLKFLIYFAAVPYVVLGASQIT